MRLSDKRFPNAYQLIQHWYTICALASRYLQFIYRKRTFLFMYIFNSSTFGTVAVVVLCFLLTMTTPFEYKLNVIHQNSCSSIGNVSHCKNVSSYSFHFVQYKLAKNQLINSHHFRWISVQDTIVELLDSDLGQHPLYKQIFYIFTDVIFKFLPLIMLTVLNYFLIMTVRRSHRMRNTMTNTRQVMI